jgi:hypothetical protein
VPWWSLDNQPGYLATLYRFQLLRYLPMVVSGLKVGFGVLSERY